MVQKLFACIISDAGGKQLIEIAKGFSPRLELLENGILFDVGGLDKLIGTPQKIAERISQAMALRNMSGNLAISTKIESAVLVAENRSGIFIVGDRQLEELPLTHLPLKNDLQKIFDLLGIKNVKELKKIPEKQLIARYGQEFRTILDLVHGKGNRSIVQNIKETCVSWIYELDFAVENLEQLTFTLAHGLDDLFQNLSKQGYSTERIDIDLKLESRADKPYSITISFPSTDKPFWRKLIELRLSEDSPGEAITGIKLTAYFAKPRSAQIGLFSAIKPNPENLLLTVSKIGKLVGSENIGIPVVLNQRIPKPFRLDSKKLPSGRSSSVITRTTIPICFSNFEPELPAEAIIQNRRLIYLKTKKFKGRVVEYGGVWRGTSEWWNAAHWKLDEWDVELESGAVYRLVYREGDWFVTGVY